MTGITVFKKSLTSLSQILSLNGNKVLKYPRRIYISVHRAGGKWDCGVPGEGQKWSGVGGEKKNRSYKNIYSNKCSSCQAKKCYYLTASKE